MSHPRCAEKAGWTRSLGDWESIRLLYAAPRFDYGRPERGFSYEENNFFDVLLHSGLRLVRFDPLAVSQTVGTANMNEALLDVAFRFAPTLAFFSLLDDEVSPTTLNQLQGLGARTLNWFGDDHWRYHSFSCDWAPRFDFPITTSQAAEAWYRRDGISRVIRSQWAVNSRLYRRLPSGPRTIDVAFIGQLYGDREQYIRALRASGVNVEVWGFGSSRGRASLRQMVGIMNRAKIVLNFSRSSVGETRQLKARTFEVPACGALLVTEQAPGLAEVLSPGDEAVVFTDRDNLVELVKYFLEKDDERQAIAQAGYARVIRDHTYERRFTEILSHVLSQEEPRPVGDC